MLEPSAPQKKAVHSVSAGLAASDDRDVQQISGLQPLKYWHCLGMHVGFAI